MTRVTDQITALLEGMWTTTIGAVGGIRMEIGAKPGYVRVVNHVHTKKVHVQDQPPNPHEFQRSLGDMYLLPMYMIYYS